MSACCRRGSAHSRKMTAVSWSHSWCVLSFVSFVFVCFKTFPCSVCSELCVPVFRQCRVSLLWERLTVWLWSLVSLNCNTVYLHLHCQQCFSLRITSSLYHQWTRNKPINRRKPKTLDLLIDRNLDLTADVCIEDTQQWFSQLQRFTFSVSVIESQMKDTQWLSQLTVAFYVALADSEAII